VARRIDIELTSTRADGTWTWRAAGAKEPKGVLEGSLLYDGAKAGDVVRAEAEFEIEGISIISVIPPKIDNRPEAQRIEIIGTPRGEPPGVTTQLLGRTARRREGPEGRGTREGRPTRERPSRERNGRGGQEAPQGEGTRPRGDRSGQDGAPRERTRARDRTGAGAGSGTGSDAATGEQSAPRRERAAPRKEGGAGRSVRPGPGRPSSYQPGEAPDGKSKRLNPGHVHRQAMLDSLAPEQRPIAEQVLRGGIPAVRTALHLEREKAAAEGRPTPNTDQLVAMAEELLPRLKAAEWRDRAEAAAKDADGISLRDLRSVVVGADVARDDETRALAATLREALERRAAGLHDQWTQEIVKHLDENRVVRALRLSARPPEPLARLDGELSARLSEAASEALSPDAAPDRWLALLEAAAASPVRRSIKPAGLPADPAPEVKQAAYQQSGRIPALAAMLGVSIPPPPTPSVRRPRPSGGPRTQPRRPPEDRSRRSAEPTPRPDEPTSRPDERTPTATDPTPTADEPTPVSDEPTPVSDEPAPTATDPTPAADEPTPVSDGLTTTPAEPATTPAEPATASTEPASAEPQPSESAEGRQDPPVVEELGEPLGEPQVGDLG
jgi:hypothetical protein